MVEHRILLTNEDSLENWMTEHIEGYVSSNLTTRHLNEHVNPLIAKILGNFSQPQTLTLSTTNGDCHDTSKRPTLGEDK